ncbi:GNAT family N-acetyltransferase [Streptomyces sp. TRM 70351]|uniref:GNAT family N-acetyltransferase n=1 Tax=Streptomyces sp. TRM 70351 TaxID=3116552 RepID=UPI002E7AFD7E|nr:GNAT family N-acetyltransferase [Streptomyces sp. TRM 70351]MEE1929485.1 GNAT family N-acetyltransferase [Streptomyces sp. TRM 70351]
MQIIPIPYDHPDAVKLDAEVQQEYAERYASEGDVTPLAPEMFEPPRGLYLLAYDDAERPVATGGWRAMDRDGEGYADGDAEVKRMFVVRDARGRGLARTILARLEDSARAAGRVRMVLETGIKQPEAIALYRSSGYEPCGKFGCYREEPDSRCFAKPLRPDGSLPAHSRVLSSTFSMRA